LLAASCSLLKPPRSEKMIGMNADTASLAALGDPRFNNLQFLYLSEAYSMVIGSWRNHDSSALKIWSMKNGRLDTKVLLGENQIVDQMTVGHLGEYVAVATISEKRRAYLGCYSLKARNWLWKIE